MCCCLKVPIKRDVEAAVNQTKVLSVKRQSYCVLAHRPPTLTNTANPTRLPSDPPSSATWRQCLAGRPGRAHTQTVSSCSSKSFSRHLSCGGFSFVRPLCTGLTRSLPMVQTASGESDQAADSIARSNA